MSPSDAIEIPRLVAAQPAPLDGGSSSWQSAPEARIGLDPAPVAMAAAVSSTLARSTGHGRVRELRVRALHDGESVALRLEWADPTRDDLIDDLDKFVDAAAVMFPLAPDSEALTMGSSGAPVNIWLWKADRAEPFDVVARGYSTSRKRPASTSGLEAEARHDGAGWQLVLRRPLATHAAETAGLAPGETSRLAFAIWDGSKAERSGQKSTSAGFVQATLAP